VKYGYARVSTLDQNPVMQIEALDRAGCERPIFKDQLSGAVAHNRAALKRCLKKLEPGDTLIVWKLDRLARSLRDLITILDDLKTRGIQFRSIMENIDTETPAGRAMWQMIGVFAELERNFITERTKAGALAARKRGVKFGRKRSLTEDQLKHARELTERGENQGRIAELLKVSRTTLYRRLRG